MTKGCKNGLFCGFELPALAQHQPHSTEHGSVEAELIARASHNHALFRDDNASVYHYLEEATRTTVYAASIKPFQRAKNGRGAWLALVGQYAGNDKWEAEIQRQDDLLHNRVWKGQTNFSLESFISQHRNAFVSMQACAQHVEYQLPNEHTRVGYLLTGIQCPDPGLQAAMASVKTDNGPGGMRNNFESTASHLLPYDPVAKKRAAGNKRGNGLISGLEGGDATAAAIEAGTGNKPAIGKTGVHLRWYKKHEFDKLSKAQKKELHEWRDAQPDFQKGGKGKGKGKGKYYNNKQLAALVSKRVRFELDKGSEEKQMEEGEAYIAALVDKKIGALTSQAPTADAATAPKQAPTISTLKAIIKRSKNGS